MSESAVKALQRAVEIAGGQAKLANSVNERLQTRPEWRDVKRLKQAHIWAWLNRTQKVPGEYGIPIEEAVDRGVTRHQLCPSVFGAQ
jgi:hypothetical protein